MNIATRFVGKTALVTGADTGIGREIALEFARQGASVVLHYCHHPNGAFSAADEIKALGPKAVPIRADFDDISQVLSFADQAIAASGSIDYLVNNAGISFNKPFLNVTPDQFNKLFNVNFKAQYFLTQRVVAHMLERNGGAVCNISSIHALQGAPEHSAYAATKGAIIAFTRALAVEFAYRGIRINAIAPGPITVENHFKAIPGYTEEQARKDGYNAVPAARYGSPIDVARLATFLCAEESSFMVGQTLTLDGGTTALMCLVSDFRKESTARFGVEYLEPSAGVDPC